MKKAYLSVAVLFGLFFGAQIAILQTRIFSAPSWAEGAFAAMGGFRSIGAEIVWFRADRLQEEGRYVELAELARALTTMEPHTPEVWSYAAWNLAYNISVMMDTPEDRWRWVLSGIRLLRDQGLRLNPGSPELARELAWLFELKLGTDLDSASPQYRRFWAELVREVEARGVWQELGMDLEKMRRVERELPSADWTNPFLSAIYWAEEGLPRAQGRDRKLLLEIIRQSKTLYLRSQNLNRLNSTKGVPR